ncbi:GTP-binding protein [Candidatus Hodarchaeum mangrovi]
MSTQKVKKAAYYKIVFLGDRETGKTSLIRRMFELPFSEDDYSPTSGLRYENLDFTQNEKKYYLQFCDVSGNSIYLELLSSILKSATIVLLIFDYKNEESQERIKQLFEIVKDNLPPERIFIIGNKFEKEKKEIPKQLISFISKNNFQIYPISVKENKGIQLILQSIIKTIDKI